MQNSVLISIFTSLLTKRGVTREYLSQKFELSTRTITRYVDVLMASGIPIISRTGQNGGYFLSDDYKIDKMLFSENDIRRIVSSLKLTATYYGDQHNGKIIDTLKNVYRHYNEKLSFELSSDIIIDSVPSAHESEIHNSFDTIIKAIRRMRKVSIIFNQDIPEINIVKNVSVEIDPYHVVYCKNKWFFYGFCAVNHKYFTYPFVSISDILMSPRLFTKRQDSNIYNYLLPQLKLNEKTTIEYDFCATIRNSDYSKQYNFGLPQTSLAKSNSDVVAKILSFGYSEKVSTAPIYKKEISLQCRKLLENF